MPASQDLLDAARTVRLNAHVPYSHFAVGAAIRTSSGKIFAGANVENASYPEGICAEASAIGAMVSAGEREIVEVLTVADGEHLVTCCGGCRQKLRRVRRPGHAGPRRRPRRRAADVHAR